ncbi:hypothetical protein AwEntero_15730 [Enterobacterales bacterium]|nr:hypothetical protein AwEntero_15730 [Enterobacterales bacterium]
MAAKAGADNNIRIGSNFFNFALQKIKGQRILSEHGAVSNPSAGVSRIRFDGYTLSHTGTPLRTVVILEIYDAMR